MHNRIPDPIICKINRLTYEIKDIQEKLEINTAYTPEKGCD